MYNFVNARNYYCGCGEVEDDSGEYVEYTDYQKLLDENAQLHAAIDRVRALHSPVRYDLGIPCCEVCVDSYGDPRGHPCPTLRAIDGEDA